MSMIHDIEYYADIHEEIMRLLADDLEGEWEEYVYEIDEDPVEIDLPF
jgi:hypothetical protein